MQSHFDNVKDAIRCYQNTNYSYEQEGLRDAQEISVITYRQALSKLESQLQKKEKEMQIKAIYEEYKREQEKNYVTRSILDNTIMHDSVSSVDLPAQRKIADDMSDISGNQKIIQDLNDSYIAPLNFEDA